MIVNFLRLKRFWDVEAPIMGAHREQFMCAFLSALSAKVTDADWDDSLIEARRAVIQNIRAKLEKLGAPAS